MDTMTEMKDLLRSGYIAMRTVRSGDLVAPIDPDHVPPSLQAAATIAADLLTADLSCDGWVQVSINLGAEATRAVYPRPHDYPTPLMVDISALPPEALKEQAGGATFQIAIILMITSDAIAAVWNAGRNAEDYFDGAELYWQALSGLILDQKGLAFARRMRISGAEGPAFDRWCEDNLF